MTDKDFQSEDCVTIDSWVHGLPERRLVLLSRCTANIIELLDGEFPLIDEFLSLDSCLAHECAARMAESLDIPPCSCTEEFESC